MNGDEMALMGFDVNSLWQSVQSAGVDLVTKALPAAAQKAVTQEASKVIAPIATQAAQDKAASVASKGQVAAFAAGGIALGAIIAGGSWKRRAVGGGLLGLAGALVGLKIGWLLESQ